MSNTRHHEFSPSKLERLAACPWSYRNCIGWSEENSAASARGTVLHAAIHDETAYNALSPRDRAMVDFIRAEHLKLYQDKGMEQYHEFPVQIVRDGVILSEGTLDYLVIGANGDNASVKDWKFGNYEVTPAEENAQIKAYVCGVFHKFPKVQTVYAMIVQPAYDCADYDRQAVFTRDQYDDLLREIQTIIDNAKFATEDMARPSAENCRYCNKMACRAFRAKMDRNLDIFSIDPEQLSVEEAKMTIDFADRLLCARKEIETLMDAKTDAAKKMILANGGSANFRVQPGRVNRRTDWKLLAEKFNIPESEIEAATVCTEGEPYLMPRMRRKPTLKIEAKEA